MQVPNFHSRSVLHLTARLAMEPESEENNKKASIAEMSILDKKPLRVFGHPLTTSQQMWLGFFIPASISMIVFIVNFSLDIAVAFQLLRDGHTLLAGATIILVYAPSIVCFILTLTAMPQLEKVCDIIIWIIIQLFQCILFPVAIIYRFATRLFWSIVAITEDDPVREKALRIAGASHQSELFFFVDSFLNAAPQALLQAYILLSPQIVTSDETGWTLAVSIVMSVISLSKTAAIYQRFESQRAVGRTVPWECQSTEAHIKALVNLTKVDPLVLMGILKTNETMKRNAEELSFVITPPLEEHQQTEEQLNDPTMSPQTSNEQSLEGMDSTGADQEEGNPTEASNPASSQADPNQSTNNQEAEILAGDALSSNERSTCETQAKQNDPGQPNEQDALLPVKVLNSATQSRTPRPSLPYLEPIITQNVIVEDRCFWPRISTPPSTPTADPHMRPRLSINTLKTIKRPSFTTHIALPVRKPREKGLHEDEPLGIFTVFNAWATYLLGRILVIAAFTHFYLWPSVGLFLSHYAMMVAYLCFCNPCRNFWTPFLGLIYILCPLEVNVRYQYPRVFLVLFFALALLEDLSTVVLWYCGAEWESMWYDFAFFFIIGCHGMAAMNVSLYLFLFKPQTKYVDQSNRWDSQQPQPD